MLGHFHDKAKHCVFNIVINAHNKNNVIHKITWHDQTKGLVQFVQKCDS